MQKGAKQYDEACVSGRDGPWRAGGRRHRYGGGRQEHAEPRRAPDGPACRPQNGPHEGRPGRYPGPVSSKRGAAKKPYLFFILDFHFIYVILNTSFSLALQYNIYTQKKTRNNVSFFVFILLYY